MQGSSFAQQAGMQRLTASGHPFALQRQTVFCTSAGAGGGQTGAGAQHTGAGGGQTGAGAGAQQTGSGSQQGSQQSFLQNRPADAGSVQTERTATAHALINAFRIIVFSMKKPIDGVDGE